MDSIFKHMFFEKKKAKNSEHLLKILIGSHLEIFTDNWKMSLLAKLTHTNQIRTSDSPRVAKENDKLEPQLKQDREKMIIVTNLK